ncbi:MAG: hypothetical protein DRG59_03430 [Deltaproteobacteria bacterium]|nr:MAG: hypothetical protein DRG59_03430 [Deltaproteobacteria bacterium]
MENFLSILQTCQPRSDILTSEFNPEIFTANLGEVVRFYKGEKTSTSDIYTDAEKFFTDATYPTQGLLNLFRNVLRRVTKNDGTAPGTTRLESGFGGGKTHGLIGIVHLIKHGTKLKHFVSFIEPDLLPSPDTVRFAGIVGTELDLHKTIGKKTKTHTLWGEIALQLGGHQLYEELEPEVSSLSAPGKQFFDKVFGNQPCVILIDELAQYATRLKFDHPGAEQQLSAFLLALMGYSASRNNLSIVITLAGGSDIFGTETERLRETIENEGGKTVQINEVDQEIRQLAQDLRTISARQEQAITPVTPDELPRIMAKRLFENIDYLAAEQTAFQYVEMYSKSSEVPGFSKELRYQKIIEKHYPFHPTLIDLLDRKLSIIPTFQRTRGLLRVLTLTIRTIWEKQLDIPLIHSCHIDLYDSKTVDELFGRTDTSELKTVLSADIGSCAPDSQNSRLSRAQQLDREKPHPHGYPVHEWTWKVVLLHSLVGRSGEHGKSIFGISKEEAALEVSFPGLEPVFVARALDSLEEQAFYLKKDPKTGKFFASLEPTINKIIAEAEKEIIENRVNSVLAGITHEIIPEIEGFETIVGVIKPADIPDRADKPKLAVLDINLKKVPVKDFFTSTGEKARIYQNLVFLLVPRTVESEKETRKKFVQENISRHVNYLKKITRSNLACKRILNNPERYGLKRASKPYEEIQQTYRENESVIKREILSLYDSLWYPGENGELIKRELGKGAGETPETLATEIKRTLTDNGKLLTTDFAKTREAVYSMARLFFRQHEDLSLKKIKQAFLCQRGWPICVDENALDTLLRAGIKQGVWGIYKEQMIGLIPNVYVCLENCDNPLPDNIRIPDDWRIIKAQAIVERGWFPIVDPRKKVSPIEVLREELQESVPRKLILDEPEGVIEILANLGSLYRRGAKS